MTDAPRGYPPTNESASRSEVAKDQATQVGQTAQQSAQQVASTAQDQAKQVAQEARRQAGDLAQQATQQANEQAAVQKDKAASGLRSLSDEVRSMATSSSQNGIATDLAHQAADKLGEVAGWLEKRDPASLLDEVRAVARRKPGTFLLGAAAAGIVAGRLSRGAVDAARKDDGDQNDPTSLSNGTWVPTTTDVGGDPLVGESYPEDPAMLSTSDRDLVTLEEPPTVVSAGHGSRGTS